MTDKIREPYKTHAIQLAGIKVLELSIVVNPGVDASRTKTFDDSGSFSWIIGHSDYDKEDREIVVRAIINIGEEEDESPFKLKIAMAGIFEVDDSRFPLIHLTHWAENNAPLILYPYLRELAYSLTTRAGFPGVMLPLLQIPTFKISKESDNDLPISN